MYKVGFFFSGKIYYSIGNVDFAIRNFSEYFVRRIDRITELISFSQLFQSIITIAAWKNKYLCLVTDFHNC